jgi:hypothetical protein
LTDEGPTANVDGSIADGEKITVREEYSGPLVGLMGRSIPDLQPSFDKFVNGLKARAETG